MAQISFDTLGYSKILRDAGFTEPQADALARAQNEAFSQMAENRELATKKDIVRLEAKMDTKMAEMDKKMAEMEARLVKSFHNALYGFAGLIIAAIACAVAILK